MTCGGGSVKLLECEVDAAALVREERVRHVVHESRHAARGEALAVPVVADGVRGDRRRDPEPRFRRARRERVTTNERHRSQHRHPCQPHRALAKWKKRLINR